MELAKIIEIASAAYPDNLVAVYFDAKRDRVRAKHPHGEDDGLARFICVELGETFDADASNEEQLREAARAIQRSADECGKVADILLKAAEEAAA